jgi:hypothetical protein
VLAHLLAEDVTPPSSLWDESPVASRLLEYETLARLNARGLGESHGSAARETLAHVAMLELVEPVVGSAGRAFPQAVRTLDALHLASMEFLQRQGVPLRLASYDRRLSSVALAIGIEAFPL